MKKIGQKLSFLTKIMLVVGLLISNLSSLSVVFAYEATADLTIELVDENLEINYNKALTEEVESVSVKVYESYTYLDGYSYEEEVKVYDLTPEEVLALKEGELELTYDSIFDSQDSEVKEHEKFDGTYKVKVELVDTTVYPEEPVVETEETAVEIEEAVVEEENVVIEDETVELNSLEVVSQENTTKEVEMEIEPVQEISTETVIAFNNYEKVITHDSGLNIKLFDVNGNEIVKEDGIYHLSMDNSSVKVVAQILSGGFAPTDKFMYDGEEFFADELLEYEFSTDDMNDFDGFLFGEYVLPVEVKVEKIGEEENGELVYNEEVNILYESYEMNAFALNSLVDAMEYEEAYSFNSTSKDGILYVFSKIGEIAEVNETNVTRTMLDIYNIVDSAVDNGEEEAIISYTLLRNGINVLEAYDASTGISLEEYLSTLPIDETVEIVLSNEGLTISFSVVMIGDLNNDNIITSEDVLELINQVIGEKEVTDLEKTDIYVDEKVDSLDVLALNQIVKSELWEVSIREEEFDLDARLDVKFNNKELDEENYLVSGNEFTVDYVLSLSDLDVNGIAGQFEYDKELFELVSVEVANEWLGNNKDGKFLYLGEESLTGPEEVTLPEEEENPSVEDELEVVEEAVLEKETLDHVVLTATFRALGATNEESNNIIKLKDIELYNSVEEVVNYVMEKTEVSTEEITVNASVDNTLQYLEVAGVKITLEPGIYEYEITVSSDVTLVDLKYILNNVAANVTSVIAPDELVEGENVIVVTVTSESGVSQDYTIKVIREKVEKEETTTQVNYDSSYTEDYENKEEEIIVTEPAEEDDDEVEEEKESNLSRIIIIVLILLVIAGLVYLIFKDDDNETKKANKDVNRLKKESIEPEVIKNTNKNNDKNVNKKSNNSGKNNSSKNKKKER